MGSHECSRNQKMVTDGFPCSLGTEPKKLFSMEFEILGLVLGATRRHHLDQQPEEFAEMVQELRSNTYVDNLMKTGAQVEEMKKFKDETTHILEDAKFTVHKWESNIKELKDQNMPNLSKILGQVWDKDDTLEIKIPPFSKDTPVTKKSILSHLGKVYDPH